MSRPIYGNTYYHYSLMPPILTRITPVHSYYYCSLTHASISTQLTHNKPFSHYHLLMLPLLIHATTAHSCSLMPLLTHTTPANSCSTASSYSIMPPLLTHSYPPCSLMPPRLTFTTPAHLCHHCTLVLPDTAVGSSSKTSQNSRPTRQHVLGPGCMDQR